MATRLEDIMFKNYEVEFYAKGKSIIVDLKDFDGDKILKTNTIDITEDFVSNFKALALSVWKDLNPKEATSDRNDYWQYYDKELDNDGGLSIENGEMRLFYQPITWEVLDVINLVKRKFNHLFMI